MGVIQLNPPFSPIRICPSQSDGMRRVTRKIPIRLFFIKMRSNGRLHPPGRDCLVESLYSFFVHLFPLSLTLHPFACLASGGGLLCTLQINEMLSDYNIFFRLG